MGWYGSAFLLTTCCFQLLLGKLYAELDIKRVFLVSLLLFEVGSVVCAVAPNSGALIAGRAVQGVGAAGVLAGAFIACFPSATACKRMCSNAFRSLLILFQWTDDRNIPAP